MQYNDVAIPIRAFVVSDMEDSLYRIQTVKSGKETIVPQSPCFLDNYLFAGDIRCAIQNTAYRLYWLCPVGLEQKTWQESPVSPFFTMGVPCPGQVLTTIINNAYETKKYTIAA